MCCGSLPSPHVKKDEWSPQTHMVDFEVQPLDGKPDVRIARGRGVGVLFVPELGWTIKLMESEDGHHLCAVAHWTNQSLNVFKTFVTHNLAMGYDVAVVTCVNTPKPTLRSFCVARSELDDEETPIFARGVDPALARWSPPSAEKEEEPSSPSLPALRRSSRLKRS